MSTPNEKPSEDIRNALTILEVGATYVPGVAVLPWEDFVAVRDRLWAAVRKLEAPEQEAA